MIDDEFLGQLEDSVNEGGEMSEEAEADLRQMNHITSRSKIWKKIEEFKKYRDALGTDTDDDGF